MTKIKNCFRFSKIDHFLKVWFLLSPKIIISSKSVVLKSCTAQTPATPVHTKFLKFSSKQTLIESLDLLILKIPMKPNDMSSGMPNTCQMTKKNHRNRMTNGSKKFLTCQFTVLNFSVKHIVAIWYVN